jgi:hypothetical protein
MNWDSEIGKMNNYRVEEWRRMYFSLSTNFKSAVLPSQPPVQ